MSFPLPNEGLMFKPQTQINKNKNVKDVLKMFEEEQVCVPHELGRCCDAEPDRVLQHNHRKRVGYSDPF